MLLWIKNNMMNFISYLSFVAVSHSLHLYSQWKVDLKRGSTQESIVSRSGKANTGVSLWPEKHKHTAVRACHRYKCSQKQWVQTPISGHFEEWNLWMRWGLCLRASVSTHLWIKLSSVCVKLVCIEIPASLSANSHNHFHNVKPWRQQAEHNLRFARSDLSLSVIIRLKIVALKLQDQLLLCILNMASWLSTAAKEMPNIQMYNTSRQRDEKSWSTSAIWKSLCV